MGGGETPGGCHGLSLRGVIVGLVMVVVICLLVSYAELVTAVILVGSQQMPPAVVAVFMVIVLMNAGLSRLKRSLGLSPADLVTVYCMMLIAAMISARGIVEKLLTMLVTANYFADPTNRWQELFFPHIKKWLVAFDPAGDPKQFVATRFFEGLRAGEHIPWGLWIVPLAAWGALCLMVLFAFLCLASILRRQWVDNEKLPFPLVQPSLELIRDSVTGGSVLRNKPLWIGFSLPVVVYAINGLHNWYPNLPMMPVAQSLDFFTSPPWNAWGGARMYFSFAAIGFCFLLPMEMLFSLWFFYMFSKLQAVIATSFGMEMQGMPMYPCSQMIGYQTAGAYIVLAIYMLYTARPHLKRVLRAAMGREQVDDSRELMPCRTAVWGLALSFVLIVAWCCLAGMSLWVAVGLMGIFIFVVALVMTRATAEAGLFMTEVSWRPIDLYRMFAPVSALGPANITMLTFMDAGFMRDQRGLVLTGIMDALKMTDSAKIRSRSFLPGLIAAIVLALLVAGAAHVWLPYKFAGLTMYWYPYRGNNLWAMWDYQGHITGMTRDLGRQASAFFGVGVVVTILLSYMRAAFYWWPLHPLGYALCGSWSMVVLWFSCAFVWIVKGFLLRYGGMRMYIRARPVFIGMMLGEFFMAALWTLISATTGAPVPEFPWP